MKKIILIGYSGHAFVVADILKNIGKEIVGYCEKQAKDINPFHLDFLGNEDESQVQNLLAQHEFLVAVGNNLIRRVITEKFIKKGYISCSAIHPKATISFSVIVDVGTTIMAGVVINPMVNIGKGVILNTSCVIEHECYIGDYVHIAPGAVLAGNVTIGENGFVGANSVIKQGVTVGKNVTIGAGSVVLKNVPDDAVVYGNPARLRN